MFAVQVSGTGHAGMEATIANCLEPGETIVVATSGIWGQRVCDLSERYGGNTHFSHQSNTHGLVICMVTQACLLISPPVRRDPMTKTAVQALRFGTRQGLV